MTISTEKKDDILIVTINRPEVMNAIDRETSLLLAQTFKDFETDDSSKIAILTGSNNQFSTGADLKAISRGEDLVLNEFGDSVMGTPRMRMSKPVLGAIEGYAIAGGMAIAAWCDMRIASRSSKFGMPDRQKGVPILGSLTVHLPRLIGLSHALDIIMTGRIIDADEAYRMGFVNRLVDDGDTLETALQLARELAACPWDALVADRMSTIESLDLPAETAHRLEYVRGLSAVGSDAMKASTKSFADASKK